MKPKYRLSILFTILFTVSAVIIYSGTGDMLTDFISRDKETTLPYATSVYPKDRWGDYSASRAFDGDISTAWVEGTGGSGIDDTIVFVLPPGTGSIHILPGYGKKNVFRINNRVKKARLSFYYAVCENDIVTVPVKSEWIDYMYLDFKDEMVLQEFQITPQNYPNWPYNTLIASLTIEEVYKGRDNDTCIAEIRFKPYSHNLDDYLEGAWHGNPIIGGGYSNRYYFHPDGTFEYYTRQIVVNETIEVPFLAAYSGYWKLKDCTLILSITQEDMIIDPNGFTVQTKTYNPPKIVEYILSPISRFEGFEDLPYMTIGGHQYWYFNYMREY